MAKAMAATFFQEGAKNAVAMASLLCIMRCGKFCFGSNDTVFSSWVGVYSRVAEQLHLR